jgi:hypothetical protein
VHHGKGFFPTPDQWLTHLKADTIVAFFGYNESFDGPSKVEELRGRARRLGAAHAEQGLQWQSRPAISCWSPHRLRRPLRKRDLPSGDKENANLILYSAAVETVAKKRG